jgi:uncharacterized protein YcaQ
MEISRDVARRFLLGRQGLWPGRRWQGLRGTERAMRTIGDLQLDPLQVVARAHDIALHGRVIDYEQDDWARLTYERRRFFEWGGWLAVRPIEELPFYRFFMQREGATGRIRAIGEEHRDAIDEMRVVLRERVEGVANRHFAMGDRKRVDDYRGRKDSALALHYLWRTGEAMVLRRERFERIYSIAERIAPPRRLVAADEHEAEEFLLRKAVRIDGLSKLSGLTWLLRRKLTAREAAAWRDTMIEKRALVEVAIEGMRGRWFTLADDVPDLESLARGRVPRAWRPLDTTTSEEVTFLSPLEPVIHDRGRTRALWGFDYLWEVYTPAHRRTFGYYALPILWGDAIVGRIDMKLDRPSATLVVNGLWFEDEDVARNAAFHDAVERGLERFRRLVRAERIDRGRGPKDPRAALEATRGDSS